MVGCLPMGGKTGRSAMKVAIVEDDAVMAMLLEEVCRIGRHEVVGVARQARSAVALVERHRPDCLLLDFSLDGEIDGVELLEQAVRIHPPLFSVMITAWDINDIAGRITAARPDRLLRKPLRTETLIGILEGHRQALARAPVGRIQPLAVR
jgi:DNA-binding NarL/FixJ family response regulator